MPLAANIEVPAGQKDGKTFRVRLRIVQQGGDTSSILNPDMGRPSAAMNWPWSQETYQTSLLISFGYLLRQLMRREDLDRMVESAKAEFNKERAELADEKDRRKLDRAIEAAASLRRIDALIYLHRSLKLWLPPHVATTALMLALMIVHIIQVVYYASR